MSLIILLAAAQAGKELRAKEEAENQTEIWSGYQLAAIKKKDDVEWAELIKPRFHFSFSFKKKKKQEPAAIIPENQLPPIFMPIQYGMKTPGLAFFLKDLYLFQNGGDRGPVFPALKLDWLDVPQIVDKIRADVYAATTEDENANIVQLFSQARDAHLQTVKHLPAEEFNAIIDNALQKNKALFIHPQRPGVSNGGDGEQERMILNNVAAHRLNDLGIKTYDDALHLAAYLGDSRHHYGGSFISGGRPDHEAFNETLTDYRNTQVPASRLIPQQ